MQKAWEPGNHPAERTFCCPASISRSLSVVLLGAPKLFLPHTAPRWSPQVLPAPRGAAENRNRHAGFRERKMEVSSKIKVEPAPSVWGKEEPPEAGAALCGTLALQRPVGGVQRDTSVAVRGLKLGPSLTASDVIFRWWLAFWAPFLVRCLSGPFF